MNNKRQTILVVDDDPSTVYSMASALKDEYEILAVTTGEEAINHANIAYRRPDIILLDVSMPEIDGFQICKTLKSNADTRRIPILFVTRFSHPQLEAHGLAIGGADYILKPFNIDVFKAKIESHLRLKSEREELERKVEELQAELKKLQKEGNNSENALYQMLAILCDRDNPNTEKTICHMKRVSEYTYLLSIKAGLNDEEAKKLSVASKSHALFKTILPVEIVKKSGDLTEEERQLIASQTKIVYDKLRKSKNDLLQIIAETAYTNTEWWNGTGYPNGIKGGNIHQNGRIVSIADFLDGVIGEGSLSLPEEKELIIDELNKMKGIRFDPHLIDLVLENIEEFIGIAR
ncbi:MAG: response regulator [Candidatus Omnitrophota bacterium]